MTPNEELAHALAALQAASFGWALACTGRRRDDAVDVLQDAYAKVLSGAARYDGRAPLKTWFFGVVRLTALEHRRGAAVRFLFGARRGADPALAPVAPVAGDVATADREIARAVAEALAALPDRQREVVHLVFYEELTIEEASHVMGVALGTARLHYDRGKKRLAELLQARGIR